jgi:hypothetical protein
MISVLGRDLPALSCDMLFVGFVRDEWIPEIER